MAIAALLRSVATKMARAPPRLPSQTSSGGICLSRFSTSTGSTPPSANLRGPQTHNKEVPSGSGWYRALVAFNKAADVAAFLMVFGSFAHMFTLNRQLDRIQASLNAERAALATLKEGVKKSNERQRGILFPYKESQFEDV